MQRLTGDLINQALEALGATLSLLGEEIEIVVIGGGNLVYSGMVKRASTKDLDILGRMVNGDVVKMRPVPQAFAQVVSDVAQQFYLPPDWINLGPASLLDKGLPEGFCDRLEREQYSSLVVWFAGRLDLIAFKIYAAANPHVNDPNPSRHHDDLVELTPKGHELDLGLAWMATWADEELLDRASAIADTLR
jgi:hypothetical protein